MSQVLYVNDTRRDEIIADVGRRRTPVVVTRHADSGWDTFKSRFLGCSAQNRRVYLEQPTGGGQESNQPLASGELLGVAFRRGHKKCLFNTVVRSGTGRPAEASSGAGEFAVGWPENLQELQRRVYQRACPPPGRSIKVRFWSTRHASNQDRPCSGVIEDLSAGGLRVRCADDNGLQMGDNLKIAFSLRSRGPQFLLDGTLRHCESKPDGTVSLGFRFLALETSRDGQEMLLGLARTVTDFQRAALRRRPVRLRSRRPRRQ